MWPHNVKPRTLGILSFTWTATRDNARSFVDLGHVQLLIKCALVLQHDVFIDVGQILLESDERSWIGHHGRDQILVLCSHFRVAHGGMLLVLSLKLCKHHCVCDNDLKVDIDLRI